MAFSKEQETLCWCCEKTLGCCSWSNDFTPVEGWDATPTMWISGTHNLASGERIEHVVHSFCVHDCPEFELMHYIRENLGKPDFDTEEIYAAVKKQAMKERMAKNNGDVAKVHSI